MAKQTIQKMKLLKVTKNTHVYAPVEGTENVAVAVIYISKEASGGAQKPTPSITLTIDLDE